MQRPALSSLLVPLLLAACPEPGGESQGGDSSSDTGGIAPPPGDSTTGEPDPTTGGETTAEPVDSSSTGEPPPPFCQQFSPEVDPVIPRVMLVLDKSGSMVSHGKTEEPGEELDGYWDHDADPATPEVTRWQSLHAVVAFIAAEFDAAMHLGAILFPAIEAQSAYNPLACPVDAAPLVPLGPQAGAQILASIPAADDVSLRGGTPTTAGIDVAIAALQAAPADGVEAPKMIVLVTDGAANCSADALEDADRFEKYDDDLAPTVAAAAAAGISTYVVGIDILDVTSPTAQDGYPDATNTYARLNELAVLGGTARDGDERFYNTTNQLELQAAIATIVDDLLPCEFTLGEPVPDTYYVDRVVVGEGAGQILYPGDEVADCASESGWQWTDPDGAGIRLCGEACALYKQTGEVEVSFGCYIP